MSSTKTVNAYLDAMQHGGDPTAYLAEDFTFEGPMLRASSKAEFLEGLAAMGPMTPRFEMLEQFERGSEVCSIYNFMVGDTRIIMSEWSTVRRGKITAQRLVYDSKAFEAALAG